MTAAKWDVTYTTVEALPHYEDFWGDGRGALWCDACNIYCQTNSFNKKACITCKMGAHLCKDLFEAALENHDECIQKLIAAGADPNVADNDGDTPLHDAARKGHDACVRTLLAAGANPNAANERGYRPLHANVVRYNCESFVRELVAAGANPNAVDNCGQTPLHWAANNGHVECVRGLVAVGADPNAVDNNGCTPLHDAAREGHDACVSFLLAAGADSNVVNDDRWTPLQTAFYHSRTECVKLLVVNILSVRALTDDEWDLISPGSNLGSLLSVVMARDGRDTAGKLVSLLPEEKRKVLETATLCLSRIVLRDVAEQILVRCV